MIRSNSFTEDNDFLIKPFLEVVAKLPVEYINEAKENGSYYNFFIETKEYIIVPKCINFIFKYYNYMKDFSPNYVSNLEEGLLNDGIDLCNFNFNDINEAFDNIINEDEYNVLPEKIIIDDDFIYYKNIKSVDISLVMFANYYKKIENTSIDNIIIFATPLQDYYTVDNNRLILKYPIWNAFKWGIENPKFVTNYNNDILKFKKIESGNDQVAVILSLDNHEHIYNKVKG